MCGCCLLLQILQTLDEAPDLAMLTPGATEVKAVEATVEASQLMRTEDELALEEAELMVKASMQSHFD
jgi:hypothetical protein